MSTETPSAQPSVQLDELPSPELTLTAEQAEAAQGGASASGALKTIAAAETDYSAILLPSVATRARER